jgi:hypothetical protein
VIGDCKKQYRATNADKIRAYQKQYRAAKADKMRAYQKEYRTAKAKEIREQRKTQRSTEDWKQQHKQKLKQYRDANVEKNREYSKRYRAANAEKLRAQKKEYRALNAEKIRAHKQQCHAARVEKDPKGTWFAKAFRAAQSRAKRYGLPYDKELPVLELPDVCPVLGISLKYPAKAGNKRSDNSPSLDRMHPTYGYVAANLRIISFRANTLKNDATADELCAVLQYVYEIDGYSPLTKGVPVIKRDELDDMTSCLNRASDGERIFVLLARDPAAPSAIRRWVDVRINLGKNKATDPQIVEALDCADRMEREREEIRARQQTLMHVEAP